MSANLFHAERLLFTPTSPDIDAIPTIFAFPNEYGIGITSLGYQVVWATLALRSDVDVRRLFTDMCEPLPPQPELLGFSLSWELDYGNLLALLERLNLPTRSNLRDEAHPIVFGGGPVLTANPEPFADFFDVILLGDGENLLGDFIEAYKEARGKSRSHQLRQLARVPGVYVPSLYEVTYHSPTEAIASITPIDSEIPDRVAKQTYRGNTLSASTVVTRKAAWPDVYLV
ncbi:radical SAM protein, partial [Oscillatoriales cyanobacterium LEGE 11467]|nr:radical SAM protein [Zarconia navalis LEGE 11467]